VQIWLAFSDEQIRNIMLLRQLYHNKLALLSMALCSCSGKELVNQMAMLEQEEQQPGEHVVTVPDITKCLKDNVDENHQTHYRVARVLYTGVSYAAAAADPGHNALLAVAYQHLPILMKLNGLV